MATTAYVRGRLLRDVSRLHSIDRRALRRGPLRQRDRQRPPGLQASPARTDVNGGWQPHVDRRARGARAPRRPRRDHRSADRRHLLRSDDGPGRCFRGGRPSMVGDRQRVDHRAGRFAHPLHARAWRRVHDRQTARPPHASAPASGLPGSRRPSHSRCSLCSTTRAITTTRSSSSSTNTPSTTCSRPSVVTGHQSTSQCHDGSDAVTRG